MKLGTSNGHIIWAWHNISVTRLQPRDDDAWCSHARLSVYLRRRVRTFLVTQFVRLGCAPQGTQNPVNAGENVGDGGGYDPLWCQLEALILWGKNCSLTSLAFITFKQHIYIYIHNEGRDSLTRQDTLMSSTTRWTEKSTLEIHIIITHNYNNSILDHTKHANGWPIRPIISYFVWFSINPTSFSQDQVWQKISNFLTIA